MKRPKKSRSASETVRTCCDFFKNLFSNRIIFWYSPQETSLQTGLRLTSKCRRQIKASTLCVKTTLGHSTSHGMAPAATTKSQTITSYDCSARSSRRLATTSGRQYLDTVCGQGEKTLLTKLVSSPRPRLVSTCMGKQTTFSNSLSSCECISPGCAA